MTSVPSAYSHIFTVDVEEHFQVNAFEQLLDREAWPRQPSRVVRNTKAILDLLEATGASATFFVLGWVAERQPTLVREIIARGHEVASHGYWHRRVTQLTRTEFRDDVRRAKCVLEDIGDRAVLGYRAPSFSIVPGGEWAFDILLEEGYLYDSSIFPIRRRGYGYPGAPVAPCAIDRPSGTLLEFPLTTLRVMDVCLPACGGAYFRHFPYAVIRRAFETAADNRTPGVFYIHPWEIDPEQPRLPVDLVTRLRHYGGLTRTQDRLRRFLGEFSFASVETHLRHLAQPPGRFTPISVAPEPFLARTSERAVEQ